MNTGMPSGPYDHSDRRGTVMSIDLEEFKAVYGKWVEENQQDFQAGKIEDAVKKYPFVVSEDVPWTPFKGQPSEKTIALVTSGGLYLKDSQPAFEAESIHGDPSFREIPRTVRPEDLGIAHPHFDHSLAEQDVNTIFPIQRLIELEKEGVVGKVADTHYSFSYVNDVARLLTESVPKVIDRMQSERVDILFLVPV
jgi:D-proline reductase (dithiol) PrdB